MGTFKMWELVPGCYRHSSGQNDLDLHKFRIFGRVAARTRRQIANKSGLHWPENAIVLHILRFCPFCSLLPWKQIITSNYSSTK